MSMDFAGILEERAEEAAEDIRLDVISVVCGLAKRKLEAVNERLLGTVLKRINDKKVNLNRHIL